LAAERQIARILFAAWISSIGDWISSSQISLRSLLLNRHIANTQTLEIAWIGRDRGAELLSVQR
jgi:hypothetical protein